MTTLPLRRLVRGVAALSLVPVALAWGWSSRESERLRAEWAEVAASGSVSEILAFDEDVPESFNRRAAVASLRAFPPDHAAATRLYAAAIDADPLDSVAWFGLGRSRLFLGDSGGARAALDRSAELAPTDVGRRLDSIGLWAALGEWERAEASAAELSALGAGFPERALRALVSAGRDPVAALDVVGFDSRDVAGKLALVETLEPEGPAACGPLLERLGDEPLSRPDLRKRYADLALRGPVASRAIAAWRARSPDLVQAGEGLWIENPDLSAPPFGSDHFPLGWIRPHPSFPSASRLPRAADDPAQLLLLIPGSERERQFDYSFYRLILPANTPARVSVSLLIDPPSSSSCHLLVAASGEAAGHSAPSLGTPGWQTLTAEIPSREGDAIADLILLRRAGLRPSRGDIRLSIGPILLEPAEGSSL